MAKGARSQTRRAGQVAGRGAGAGEPLLAKMVTLEAGKIMAESLGEVQESSTSATSLWACPASSTAFPLPANGPTTG